MSQMKLDIIPHHVDDQVIDQRSADGYINATALCQAAGKKFAQYAILASTKDFLNELSSEVGIPTSVLVQSSRGGVAQGTWVHPQVSIHLAQWLSAKFAVQVSKWVYDWMSGNHVAPLPYHLARYMENDKNVPVGHFSTLQETVLDLIGPLHRDGYEIKKGMVPDISIGLCFCKHLRDEHGYDTDAIPLYKHRYPDGRIVDAKAFPEELWPLFKKFFREVWLPAKAPNYFKSKDPEALTHLARLPALAAPTKPKAALPTWR